MYYCISVYFSIQSLGMLYSVNMIVKRGMKMKLETLALPEKNKVMQSYNKDKEFLHTFFDYKNEESSYPERLKNLRTAHLKEVN